MLKVGEFKIGRYPGILKLPGTLCFHYNSFRKTEISIVGSYGQELHYLLAISLQGRSRKRLAQFAF